MASVSKTYVVRTFGCQMNEHDSERLSGLLEADGLSRAGDVESADVVVLNTCCIRENADNKLYGTLGHLKSLKDRRPELEIVVAGCLAQKDRELIAERAPHVDVVLGTHNVHRAADLLREARASGPVTEIWEATDPDDTDLFPSALPRRREVAWSGWVTIQMGCDNSCAFCIVPAVRGPEVSRPFADVVDEVTRLVDDGVTEVTLLGQNVNSYGRDLATRRRSLAPAPDDVTVLGERWATAPTRRARPLFADLLDAVGSVPGLRRVRFTSPHPKDLRDETIAVMATNPAVCPHLHLPLQSGSLEILASMHRGYTPQRYLDRLAAARSAVADLAVSTDIIVGFPGETEQDFTDTLEVAAEAAFDSAFTFVYSPRPGTEAATAVDRMVDPAVVTERYERLRVVVERSARLANEARIGRVEEVLVEGPSKKDPTRWSGRTPHNRLVHVAAGDQPRAGSYALVEITGAAAHHLTGELVEVTQPARHRTRIAVTAG
ncbi:MAG: tRNA (N6-isopentenyl adenosine(37)-C2)-methylthiotransferase MiaB [Acidimicrobiia bacterium]|nr:tRNA (N6-isopentenyl adenosine(37)-C2)-methylthiotransferase MiaB [Acidimicrobiia bacterium]